MTNINTENKRFSYPKDERVLEDMAFGLASGEYENFAKAVRGALLKFGEEHNEAADHRLREWYRKGNWAAHGRRAFVNQEIKVRLQGLVDIPETDDPEEFHEVLAATMEDALQKKIRGRGMTVKPATDDPDRLRMWLIGTLNEVIEGYNEYGRMVTEKQSDCYGDQYLLEDYLHDWDRSLGDHGRCAVEQLVSSIVPAIHRYYETALVMEDHDSDKNGISGHYPVTKVSFTVDASKPLPLEKWARDVAGVVGDGRFKIEYSNPAMPDNRWLAPATARFREFWQRDDWNSVPRHMWNWPVKTSANSDIFKVTFEYVPQQGASSYSAAW